MLHEFRRHLNKSFDSFEFRPDSVYVSESGCTTYNEIEVEPQDSQGLNPYIEHVFHCGGKGNAEGLFVIYTLVTYFHMPSRKSGSVDRKCIWYL